MLEIPHRENKKYHRFQLNAALNKTQQNSGEYIYSFYPYNNIQQQRLEEE